MRAYLLIALLIGLVAISAGQERAVRGRIRSLIQAARNGDPEARQTLRNLRERLLQNRQAKSRSLHLTAPISQETFRISRPPIETKEITIQPAPIANLGIPEIPIAPEIQFNIPEKIVQKTQPQPVSRPRTQTRPILQEINQFEPHRAINRGLEIGSRSELSANIRVTNRTRTPPIRTIRRYSYFDEEGSYIFGYEAEDGSFKEEKRGLDCVVNGRYGYVDPDGILREYSYVSGNQCDPNAVPVNGETEKLPLNHQFQKLTTEKRLTQSEAEKLINQFKSRPASEKRRFPTSSSPKRKQKAPKRIQHSQPRLQQSQPILKQSQPRIPQSQPRIQQSQPRIQQSQPRRQQSQPRLQQSQPRIQQSQPKFQQSQPRLQQSQPRLQQSQLINDRPPKKFSQSINLPQQKRLPLSQSVLPPFKIKTIPKKLTIPQSLSITARPPFEPVTTRRGEILSPPIVKTFVKKRPPLSNFNFNNDFKTVFDNFRSRQRTSLPQKPKINITPKPKPRPTPLPLKKEAKLSPIPSLPSIPKSKGHQLVFDATSGTFKSIPIEQLAKAKQIGSLQIPAGKPLPLPKHVNSGGQTQRASPLSPQQINDLFSHFRIPV